MLPPWNQWPIIWIHSNTSIKDLNDGWTKVSLWWRCSNHNFQYVQFSIPQTLKANRFMQKKQQNHYRSAWHWKICIAIPASTLGVQSRTAVPLMAGPLSPPLHYLSLHLIYNAEDGGLTTYLYITYIYIYYTYVISVYALHLSSWVHQSCHEMSAKGCEHPLDALSFVVHLRPKEGVALPGAPVEKSPGCVRGVWAIGVAWTFGSSVACSIGVDILLINWLLADPYHCRNRFHIYIYI